MKSKMIFKYNIMILFILLILPLNQTLAHKVVVFAWVEDGRIHITGSFGSNKKAKNCQITISDQTGEVIKTTQTDLEGKAFVDLEVSINTDLTITLNAGSGHKGSWVISKEEFTKVASDTQGDEAQEKMMQMEKRPSLVKILVGIGLIFGLALIVTRLRPSKKSRHD